MFCSRTQRGALCGGSNPGPLDSESSGLPIALILRTHKIFCRKNQPKYLSFINFSVLIFWIYLVHVVLVLVYKCLEHNGQVNPVPFSWPHNVTPVLESPPLNEPPHGKTNNLHRRKQIRRSASRLCFRYSDSTIPLPLIRNFMLLALFYACTGRFVSDLFGNHIVGFPTRRLRYTCKRWEHNLPQSSIVINPIMTH